MKHLLVLALAVGFAVVPACVCGNEGVSETSTTPKPMPSGVRPRGRVQLMRNLPIVPKSSVSGMVPAAPSAPASAQ